MKKVLVLEDESSIRSFIVINLRRAGYDVIEAESGEEALERLKENPDTVHYWKPYANCETYYYSNTNLTNGVLMGTICRVNEQESNKYLTFMGGDHPVTIVTTDTEGPTIMVIKESYGNALISWLTSHYSKIILIDPREYFDNRSDIDLKAFAEEQGVDQLLVIN